MSDQSEQVPHSVQILSDLQQTYSTLSPQLRRAAQYLIERPDEIAFTSMRQLAERAGVQPATMVRLAQAIGFDGYESLREPFRDELRQQPTGFGQRARNLLARTGRRSGGRALSQLANEMVAADRENLALSLEAIGADELSDAARVLSGARRVYLVGQRSLFPAAFYVHYACSMFRDNLVLLDGNGGTFADGLRGISEDDAMLVFSFDPYSRGTIEAATYAAERGAAIVAITDSLISPLSSLTRHMLLVGTDTPALFKSVVPALAVAQVLVAQILAQGGQDALSRVAEAEEQLDSFGAYWTDDSRIETELSDADTGFEVGGSDLSRAFDRNRT
ncbi:MAG: MurR/RpiR family transcriptional regulator [Alphaproteobacteria bacterium]|nr:MurR/RpiR family transcriptional regulator [Alphaproteobacteria bacterium]